MKMISLSGGVGREKQGFTRSPGQSQETHRIGVQGIIEGVPVNDSLFSHLRSEPNEKPGKRLSKQRLNVIFIMDKLISQDVASILVLVDLLIITSCVGRLTSQSQAALDACSPVSRGGAFSHVHCMVEGSQEHILCIWTTYQVKEETRGSTTNIQIDTCLFLPGRQVTGQKVKNKYPELIVLIT